MRLAFVNYEFPPDGGGAGYASLALAREFVALGHQIDFVTRGTREAPHTETIDGICVHRVHAHRRSVHESGMLGALLFVARAAPHLRALARRHHYDAYVYYFGLPTGLLSLVPGPHRGRPYLVSLRGSDVPGFEPSLHWLHRLLRPISHRVWHRAHRVVANSEALRTLALTSFPEIPVAVIPNGAAPTPPRTQTRAENGVRVLTVARLIARKGLDTLIAALARTPREVSLDIAGEGPARDALMRLAAERGVADRVRFRGFVDHAGLASLYAHADVFVLASIAESCSMALLEAMSAGLPVIASRTGGTVELVDHGANGLLFTPKDVGELADALTTLADNAPLRQRFSDRNRMLVRERHSWRAIALQYETLLAEALSPERASAHRKIRSVA
ncbi:MAG TPA: glycosyltransferase family 4 protein [Candidatus Baltobacteraceae bacterium]|jgi:glycosyltransferase involved in cell wall biosynthesis|nr:glycosyltransferase family 4 protein [Candidatus Baltobacteraceae bacterium]